MSDMTILDAPRALRSAGRRRRAGAARHLIAKLGAIRLPLTLIFAINMSLASGFAAYVIATYL